METKRFIGNDMPRIYERIRREFGPDAVIVRTRSLLRDGADPLIEVLAAAAEAEPELALDMQWTMTGGALGRLQIARPRATVGDLEDIVAREAEPVTRQRLPAPESASEDAPSWMEGFTDGAPSRARRHEDAYDAVPEPIRHWQPEQPPAESPAPPPVEWRRRPANPGRAQPGDAQPVVRLPNSATVGTNLEAAGFSRWAAQAVERACPDERDPERALASVLSRLDVRYPEEERRAIIVMQGPEGSGRTTALIRMALDCADAGRETWLVAADSSRAAAREQMHAYADAAGMRVIDAASMDAVAGIAARAKPGVCVFADVPAGPVHLPAPAGVAVHSYLAIPAHWQRGVIEQLAGSFETGAFSGAVLTFTDLAPDLSPALSLAIETGLGLAFLSSGRDVGAGIIAADPQSLASGIFPVTSGETTDGRLVATA